ncbi:MAG TPA: endopeptidase La [Rhodocyclaceae bacterium]|nr:endopeptidase La [Rhodocyclaceae bacterium]
MAASPETRPNAPAVDREPPEGALILIPVRDLVLLPGLLMPVPIGRRYAVAATQAAIQQNKPVGVLLLRDPNADMPAHEDFHTMGTVANIVRYVTGPDGSHQVVCHGLQRFRVLEFLPGYPFYAARVERRLNESETDTPATQARMEQLKERAGQLLQLLPKPPPEIGNAIRGMTSPSALADFVAGLLDMTTEEKQNFLETLDAGERMDRVLEYLARRVEVLSLSHQIDRQTKSRMDEQQREFMLREQIKTIRRELGETEGDAAGIDELGASIARAGMPEEVESHARKELRRLARMNESSSEYSMQRTYLETLVDLPWAVTSEDHIDIAEARRILDEDHAGLPKVKRRILEYLAVKKLNPTGRSPILCFAGPPGVGKTSLGHSIAKATGRKFARVSLGGVHDEAEIRGHRRTYVGSLPGNIIQAVNKSGARNCLIMLDEVDKLGASAHGDPSAALLEVLDPAQNSTFRDNYLGVPFDLSQVMFIATANVLDAVPLPLRDRMEVIHIPGYTEEEKARIAMKYLLPRQRGDNGLTEEQCSLTEQAVRAIIRDYTREAGVRNLEREIGNVFRYAAMQIAEGGTDKVDILASDLPTILGPAKYESEVALRTGLPGVATGLAWTRVGGDILFIEATVTPGSGKLTLTGQLGDVMKESVQAALTLVKAHARRFGLAPELFEKSDLHVHVPAGAIPKDGPSAGVAMFTAITSLLLDRPVKNDVAMTGEISLRGLVLPVGGIKEKVLAALQAGISTVLLPARNRKDLDDIPEEARNQLRFVWLETVDDALREALMPVDDESLGNVGYGDCSPEESTAPAAPPGPEEPSRQQTTPGGSHEPARQQGNAP